MRKNDMADFGSEYQLGGRALRQPVESLFKGRFNNFYLLFKLAI